MLFYPLFRHFWFVYVSFVFTDRLTHLSTLHFFLVLTFHLIFRLLCFLFLHSCFTHTAFFLLSTSFHSCFISHTIFHPLFLPILLFFYHSFTSFLHSSLNILPYFFSHKFIPTDISFTPQDQFHRRFVNTLTKANSQKHTVLEVFLELLSKS